jgi:hypothetical protein
MIFAYALANSLTIEDARAEMIRKGIPLDRPWLPQIEID